MTELRLNTRKMLRKKERKQDLDKENKISTKKKKRENKILTKKKIRKQDLDQKKKKENKISTKKKGKKTRSPFSSLQNSQLW